MGNDIKKKVSKPNISDNRTRREKNMNSSSISTNNIKTEVEMFPDTTDEELASRVWNGEFGTGDARRAALGDRYDAVQALVNGGVVTTVDDSKIDNSVEVKKDEPVKTKEIKTSVDVDITNEGLRKTAADYKDRYDFPVTTDNLMYNLSADDVHLLKSVVAAEAINNPDDALAVTSVILNRADNNYSGVGVITQVTAPGQFEAYLKGNYKKYYDNSVEIPESVDKAVDDALIGVRNNNYLSFRGKDASSSSWPHQIAEGGNKYN